MGRPALLPCAIAMLYNTRAHQIDESIQLYPRTQNHCFAIADGQQGGTLVTKKNPDWHIL